ncbi:MAG: sarcosine oxidase subunit alpha family protein [Pseudomonadota bacterium]
MRIAGKGRIDRTAPLRFSFDGVEYDGFAGDTLASALIANDIKLVGRSFKYHRPRGIYSAGSEEPNALVTVGQGAQAEPNIRATMQELYPGLVSHSQNRWPSLGFDLLGVNDLAAPFLSAGFYYKTFMWPKSFWEKLYEPFIRRAAGLGALSGHNNTDKYDKAFGFCDLLVIGAGPTGLTAALAAGRAGVDVILADEAARMGGRLLGENKEIGGKPAHLWVDDVVSELASLPNVRLMTRTTITGAYDGGTYGAVERVGHHTKRRGDGAPLDTFWRIVAPKSVLAAGALERGIAFQNNDRPGILQAGAVRTYLNHFGVCPGKTVAVFGNNDSAAQTVRDLKDAGVHVAALVDSRKDAAGVDGVPLFSGAMVSRADGRNAIEAISIQTASGVERVAVDCLAVTGGWNPTVHLTCHMNGRPTWNENLASFVPTPGSIPGLVAAGACNGDMSTAACLAAGVKAVESACDLTAKIDVPDAEDDPYRIAPLWAVPGKGRAWLDFQNDVSVKDIKQAASENFRSVEHMKRYTTQGMATDQGKNSNVQALALLADATGRGIPETGTTTFRPPYMPVPIAALGAGGQNVGFAPERKTTSHTVSENMGAPMIAAGLWWRPSYFPKSGEKTWRESCDREVGYVRNSVGICDVSTLGKIDIQGPDAATLLDFVYTNMFSSLKEGRVRYGLMLREDGFVMDDGTTARLGQDHYVMTTTTAAAGQVMRHLDFATQALNPHWDVQYISVTEQWAQFAVAGPKSRDVLNAVLDAPIDNDSFPFMACGAVSVGGIDARLFRISFSGEHAYEIAVPARYGESLFETLVQEAQKLGGGAYGMEALNVARIEKGFITHSEITGRVTAYDIGMERMVSAKKDCIGKTMSQRAGLTEPDRERMVGLKAVGVVKQMTGGAHLYNEDADAHRVHMQGYITSVGWSPSLNRSVALGFVKGGMTREGDVLKMVDAMRGVETLVEVVAPDQIDPDGGRVRG